MSDNKPAFTVDIASLRTRRKDNPRDETALADAAGAQLGFIDREPRRRGRPPSPRTGQVHAKVMPNVADEIAAEAQRRGVQQGVLIEEAWELYKKTRV
jgi:hypothetical protein